MCSPCPCNAISQDVARNYERSAKVAESFEAAYTEVEVLPHWISNGSSFWYRQRTASGQHAFIYVNAEQRTRRPAFDHQRLADQLNAQGVEADASALPFSTIDLSVAGNSVRFRAGMKKWQWNSTSNDQLIEYHGDILEESDFLRPIKKELPSERSHTATSITFQNQRKSRISLLWIDWNGNARHYASIDSGSTATMTTFINHVWRVVDTETKDPIASYIAQANQSSVTINDVILAATESLQNTSRRADCVKTDDLGIFVRDYNVWVRDNDGKESIISTNGSKETPFDADRIYVSSDGEFVVVWQYTPQERHTVHQIESAPMTQLEPRLKSFEYLKPGDKVRVDRPRLFDLKKRVEIVTEDTLFQNPFKIENIGWNCDGEYRFMFNQRGHQVMRVIVMDTKGLVRTLIEETSETFIDYSQKTFVREIANGNSSDLIWASERDGWNHLYLFDNTGLLKNRITQGKWNVRAIDRVDQKKQQIWFQVLGLIKHQDPYYMHLARVNFDGSGLCVLTEGDGTHKWKWSRDNKFFIDTWSRMDLAPRSVLRDENGNRVVDLEVNSLEKLLAIGWNVQRFHALARDEETDIYGIIIPPLHFDPQKRYPVIEEIYAGPQGFNVPKAFKTMKRQHELAELGFVVVLIDGMGTNWRSKAFHDICWKNLKDAGLPDRVKWIQSAAKTRPWMDVSKVGVYGGSAGGQSAMSAVLWHGDFYKAAVADCGCHDNRMDKLWWNESWMGWPVDRSYEESSNVVHAGKLTGSLMLMVGELDDNVDPASTMQVVDALNKASKDYELVFIPGNGHCAGMSSPYGLRRLHDFFVKHLLGVQPPNRNQNKS